MQDQYFKQIALQVQEALGQFYQNSDPVRRQQAHQWLINFQNSPESFEVSFQLLNLASGIPEIQFFGAQTIQLKAWDAWKLLKTDEEKELFKNRLMQLLHCFSQGQNLVLNKLCAAIANLVLHIIPQEWPSILEDMLKAFNTKDSLNVLMQFFKIFPEEFLSNNMVDMRRKLVKIHIDKSVPMILEWLNNMFFSIISQSGSVSVTQSKDLFEILRNWILFKIPISDILPFSKYVFQAIREDSPSFDVAIDIFEQLISLSVSSKLTSVQNQILEQILEFQPFLINSIKEENLDWVEGFTKILVCYGENFVEEIANRYMEGNQTIRFFIEMMFTVTDYPDICPLDQEVTSLTLDFWSKFQDIVIETFISPLDESENPEYGMKERSGTAIFSEIFYRLFMIFLKSVKYPSEETWQSWNKENQAEFRKYRNRIGDIFSECYMILRERLLSILAQMLTEQVSQLSVNNITNAWQDIECTLFCLRSVAESVEETPSQSIDQVMGIAFSLPLHQKMTQTSILMIGSYSDWLNSNTHLLFPCIQYLLSTLSLQPLIGSALAALRDICDSCRYHLGPTTESLLKAYEDHKNIMTIKERKILIQSLVAIMETLEGEPLLQCLKRLALPMVSELEQVLVKFQGIQNDAMLLQCKENLINILTLLATIASMRLDFAKSPSSTTSSSPSPEEELQQQSLAKEPQGPHPLELMFLSLWPLLETTGVGPVTGKDSDIIRSLSSVLKAFMQTMGPSFSVKLQECAQLLCNILRQNPISEIYDNACILLNSVHDFQNAQIPMFLAAFSQEIISITLYNLSTFGLQKADYLSNFFTFLSGTIKNVNGFPFKISEELLNGLLKLTLAVLQVQERETVIATIGFISDMIGKYNAESASEKERMYIMQILPQILHDLLIGIGGQMPRSWMPAAASCLNKIRSSYFDITRGMMQNMLMQEGFPSVHVTAKDKQNFLTDILKSKNGHVFKDIVYRFSLKCRQMENAGFGATH